MVLRIAFAVAALAATAPAVGGGTSAAVLTVSAAVQPSAVLRVQARGANVSISESDIARGYLDVPAGALFTMDTGRVRPQIAAELSPGTGPFRTVEVRSEPAGGDAAPVYRFSFSDRATAGSYQVPLTLSIGL
jgi:hypothetical protein